ncbi:hypothetical protein BGZ61DRAFT_484946 [Ilyonectria robusta]|uniref:uncharacterized protein n=1 Tax=Ilyonectria robusta TaxID=1079257 RepID=UPI001E8D25C8|nr:uncharacterized protein BGZ61DRAFT_484946 [Ilyonectria robusta]KAH8663892.1 hypothetical protein BGZ61DRAFT_484946 [Ilyonectria robusta]
MVMQRQHHKKSRGGCLESHTSQLPRNSSAKAIRSPAQAAYETSPSNLLTDFSYSSGASSPQRPYHPADEFDLHDLGLLHHWILKTSRTIFQYPVVDNSWSVRLPQLGLQHPFVMYGILSLASLHFASLDPCKKESHMSTAVSYYYLGLKKFREASEESIGDCNDALVAFSIFNIIYSFATFGPLSQHTGTVPRTSCALGLEWIYLIQSVQAAARPMDKHVYERWLSIIPFEEIDSGLELVAGDYCFLHIQGSYENSSPSDMEMYDSTLTLLRRCHCCMVRLWDGSDSQIEAHGFSKWVSPLIFLQYLSDAYVDKLYQRQPPALILFSFFGALLSAYNDSWFMEGWATSIVSAVDDALGDSWASYTDWCRETVAIGWVPWATAS